MGELALTDAVEALYEVFGRYPLRDTIEGCPCCVGDRDQAELRSAPLRELSEAALRRFSGSAISTWGEVDDLRHFLPRMLELGVEDVSMCGLDEVVSKLRLASWRRWPAPERQAIDDYFDVLWLDTLQLAPKVRSARDLLYPLRELYQDIAPFLALWRENLTEPALAQLAELVDWTSEHQRPEVTRWLAEPWVEPALEAGFFAASTPEVAEALSDAVERLDWQRRTSS